MKKIIYLIVGLSLWLGSPLAHAGDPLFADETVIKIRIESPITKLVRQAKRSTDPFEAQMILEGAQTEVHHITLAARGKSRRTEGFCKFPPLRVKFKDKPSQVSFFKGQKSLKLVTHCKSRANYHHYNFREYSVYKLYNKLTPQSLNVRLAHIDYVDTDSGKIYATRYGFFIEDMDDAAERNGMKELDVPKISRSQLNAQAAARASLFNYMVGNLDFSMTRGAPGSDCCHNGKLMGATKSSTDGLIYVPYDFDQTGLVDAPYATPPDSLKVRSVRSRVYRGYCDHNSAVMSEAQNILQKKDRLKAVIASLPLLEDKSKQTSLSYLDGFFETLSDPKDMERKILNKCRK
jgi:hypothetical protein